MASAKVIPWTASPARTPPIPDITTPAPATVPLTVENGPFIVITGHDLHDLKLLLEQTEGKTLDSGYDFGEYRERVNRYIMEHRSDTLAIHKLTQNIPLSRGDYTELEHIFTCELGSKEDYAREFKDTPFGLLVRKVAKLDHEAAMQAFHAETAKPTCIIMDTTKGKGVSFMTNSVDWHGKGPNDDEYKVAMEELNAAYAALEQEEK
mgnify:CR=1 FL=1